MGNPSRQKDSQRGNPEKTNPSPLYYVGIGASAGGLEALRPFVANLPSGSNMTFILAQHMSPDHRSLMVELLIRETDLKVEEARHNTLPRADTIYVAPPNSDIAIINGKLRLSKPHNAIGPKPSVDRFFMSLADDREDKTIGIILSGTGSDGAHGIKAIKAAGGITIAQEPQSAKYDSMPKAAVRTGGADLVLTPAGIASQLVSIVQQPRAPIVEDTEDKEPPSTMRGIIRQIAAHTGMDFSNYKESTISRQILRRMTAMQIGSIEDYGEHLSRHREELHELAGNFLICVTSFFRDPDAFEALREAIRGILLHKKPGDEIRVWVPGCASGEEVYSIAILLAEEMGGEVDKYRIQIFATDINNDAVQMARGGIYTEAALAGVDGGIIKKYFTPRDGVFHIAPSLKEMVLFARQDLAQDPPFVRLDLISCRNLLIYFKPELQDRVFRVFHYALRPGGVLFLGKSETVGKQTPLFAERDRSHKLYVKRDVTTPVIGGFNRNKASPSAPAADDTPPTPPASLGHERLFELYAPASLLITADGEILEFFGECSHFLVFKKGRADFNLFNIIKPPFRAELRAFVHRVERARESARGNRIALSIDGTKKNCRLAVHYVGTQETSDASLLIVSFEIDDQPLPKAGQTGQTPANEARITELEQEVTLTRENLQTVIEELETANEELQSLNEEAQAANEELQASNEELETANEELQASNEELVTVNDELMTKSQELADTNNDMENILNSLEQAIVVVNKSLSITRFNRMAIEFFSIPPGRTENLTAVPTTFEMPDLLDRISSVMKTATMAETTFRKGERHFIMRVTPYFAGLQRSVDGAVMTINEITERVIAEEKLRLSASVFEAASEATIISDANNRIVSVNPAFTAITGYSAEEVIGKTPALLSSGKHSKEFYKNMWESLLANGTWRGEVWNKRKNGQIYAEWLTINVLRDEKGEVIRYIAVFSDITDSKKSQELIEKQANYDTLTGLPNRNLIMDRLHQLLATSRRNRQIFAVLFMDLDDFKSVNDSLGHHHGDEMLKRAAQRIGCVLRESDSVGRLGGDEFLVLLGNLSSTDDIIPVVDKILAEIAKPMVIGGRELHTAASIGVTVYPADGDTAEVLLMNADSAMYAAKQAGRNTFSFFTRRLQDEANRRHWIANELKIAVRQEQLEVHYQPIIDLRTDRVIGAEALLRWNHPQRGYIPACEFIGVAEQNGMIGNIGQQVFEMALAEAGKWPMDGDQPMRLSLNLSPAQLVATCDMERILKTFADTPLAGNGALIVEITESIRLAERRECAQVLRRLHALGCRIAIDDFGTGFSSLSYLRQLPIDIIKIDKSFVRDIMEDPEDAAMIRAILTLADSLNMTVVAEGVETPDQLQFLKRHHCAYAQGYLFSHALPPEAFLSFTQKRAAHLGEITP